MKKEQKNFAHKSETRLLSEEILKKKFIVRQRLRRHVSLLCANVFVPFLFLLIQLSHVVYNIDFRY